jgi:pyruvate dehydrogenase E2 component (dihydrolipoamide acetyltransferase)
MREVIMPKLGLMMEVGTIVRWLKREGDTVRVGEPLLEVLSDKATIEVEAADSGTLLRIFKEEGAEVPVTEVIAWIGEPGEAAPREQPAPAGPRSMEERVRITPAARRLAGQRGVDIRGVKGTGPEGRITLEDVERASASAAPPASSRAPRVRSSEPLKGIRKVIAERLTASARTVPHVTLTAVIDAGPLVELKERLAPGGDPAVRPTVSDFLLKAAARVLSEQPAINSSLVDDRHVVYGEVNIGLAVDTERGLLVPTIYGADRQPLAAIARARQEAVDRIRASRQTAEDLANGTFTISNLGMFGIRHFTAIINPPQAAILAVGEIYRAPRVEGERVVAGLQMEVSLTVDHRIADGADAARFLGRLRELLQEPGWMAEC